MYNAICNKSKWDKKREKKYRKTNIYIEITGRNSIFNICRLIIVDEPISLKVSLTALPIANYKNYNK